ncbi:hypothetical protein B0H17DRAFT_1154649 [Mycena rosella]|uniref:Uncharacterized protein n=1 Tax=Mycena rosella TaxID=1033263 RepID=A0AAD7AYD4_MYCRO|nr:hypothetical protein B0H17DRAFT_1154649 [Mycena rosella]
MPIRDPHRTVYGYGRTFYGVVRQSMPDVPVTVNYSPEALTGRYGTFLWYLTVYLITAVLGGNGRGTGPAKLVLIPKIIGIFILVAEALDSWTESMTAIISTKDYMHQAALLDSSAFRVKRVDSSTTKVLARSESSRPEAIVTVVGVLKSFDLPPVKKNSITSARVPYARAYPEIVGYDSKHFVAAMENIKDLAYSLASKFPSDTIEHWVLVPGTTEFGPAIGGSCRYFTLGADIAPETKIEKYVDPSGTLSDHLGNKVAHCIDNDVAYLCIKMISKWILLSFVRMQLTTFRYVKKDPAGFRVGDIVEMGFALVAFRQASRNKDDKQICMLVLRTLTFLHDSFAKAVFKARHTNEAKATSVASRPTQVRSLVKKCFDFHELSSDDEDYPETRRRMAAMRVGDNRIDMETSSSHNT